MIRLGLFFLIIVGACIFVVLLFKNREKDKLASLLQILHSCKNYECDAFNLMTKMRINAYDLKVLISSAEAKGMVQKFTASVALTEFGKEHYERFILKKEE